ncbi:MAG: hypothetical protein ACR2KJ_14565 [Jatrophihabitans sp.]
MTEPTGFTDPVWSDPTAAGGFDDNTSVVSPPPPPALQPLESFELPSVNFELPPLTLDPQQVDAPDQQYDAQQSAPAVTPPPVPPTPDPAPGAFPAAPLGSSSSPPSWQPTAGPAMGTQPAWPPRPRPSTVAGSNRSTYVRTSTTPGVARKKSKLGCLPLILVVLVIGGINVGQAIYHRVSVPTGVHSAVHDYYLHMESNIQQDARNDICLRDRPAWDAALKIPSSDINADIDDETVGKAKKAGSHWTVPVTLQLSNGKSEPKSLSVIKEAGDYRICGGLLS